MALSPCYNSQSTPPPRVPINRRERDPGATILPPETPLKPHQAPISIPPHIALAVARLATDPIFRFVNNPAYRFLLMLRVVSVASVMEQMRASSLQAMMLRAMIEHQCAASAASLSFANWRRPPKSSVLAEVADDAPVVWKTHAPDANFGLRKERWKRDDGDGTA